MSIRILMVILFGLALAAAPALAETIVAANFNDGNGTTAVDAFKGMADTTPGWAGAWTESMNTAGNFVVTSGVIENADPADDLFLGGGNYLKTVQDAQKTNTNQQFGVGRQHVALDPTKVQVFEFYFRLDDDLSTFGSAGGGTNPQYDRYQIFPAGSMANVASSGSTWQIHGYSVAEGNCPSGCEMEWSFVNGAGNATLAPEMAVNTDVPLVAGETYYFRITQDLSAYTYDAYVRTTVGSTVYEYDSTADANPAIADGLGFRSNTQTNKWLCFTSRANTADDLRAFSLDGVTITAVPEPGTLALVLAAIVVFARRRVRR